jgi:hypothetical protein
LKNKYNFDLKGKTKKLLLLLLLLLLLSLLSLINFKKLLLLSKKNYVGTRGAWAAPWGLGTPPAPIWC